MGCWCKPEPCHGDILIELLKCVLERLSRESQKEEEEIIRVGQRQIRKSYPSKEEYIQIPAWSRGKGYKDLSPFFLGPVKINDLTFHNLENAWQYLKVYPCHVDSEGNPNKSWEKWCKEGCSLIEAQRHPMKGVPLYSYYKGCKLDVVKARKQIYIPLYKKLVRKTTSYKKLLDKLKSGDKLLLIEPDGPNLQTFPEGIPFTRDLFKKLVSITDQKTFFKVIDQPFTLKENKYFPLGHGYVLADALLEDLE